MYTVHNSYPLSRIIPVDLYPPCLVSIITMTALKGYPVTKRWYEFCSSFGGVGLVGVFLVAANKLVTDISFRVCSISNICLPIGSSSVEGVVESFVSERSSTSD